MLPLFRGVAGDRALFKVDLSFIIKLSRGPENDYKWAGDYFWHATSVQTNGGQTKKEKSQSEHRYRASTMFLFLQSPVHEEKWGVRP